MSKNVTVIAFDFGGSSGRSLKVKYENNKLSYEETHRFENVPIEKNGSLYWDFETLLSEVYKGIEKSGQFDSIAFDTWGLDFGLIDENGDLIDNPVHYRDTRTNGMSEKICEKLGKESIYKETGNQIMDVNTLYQLFALKEKKPETLKKTKKLLFMPDLFAYKLTGKTNCEISIASTSQMLNPKTKDWSKEILSSLDIPENIFSKIIPSGTVVGMLGDAKVIAVAGHDTQCAVTVMPTQNDNVAFLSCGTWSLLGTELDEPMLTKESQDLNLSNEIGANNKINFLKNIIGLWLIQESRREWKRQGKEYSYADLERMALDAKPLVSFIDPDSPEFATPGDIPKRVQEYCENTNQVVPQTIGEIMRCIYESLALKYCYALEQLKTVTSKQFSALHILGGGTKDKLLCQMTANSCQIPVIAGPTEATALGNAMIQFVTLGALKNIDECRDLIKQTEELKEYSPKEKEQWNEAFLKYKKILDKEN